MTREEMEAHLILHGWKLTGMFLGIEHPVHSTLFAIGSKEVGSYPTDYDAAWKSWDEISTPHLKAFCDAIDAGLHLIPTDMDGLAEAHWQAILNQNKRNYETLRQTMLYGSFKSNMYAPSEKEQEDMLVKPFNEPKTVSFRPYDPFLSPPEYTVPKVKPVSRNTISQMVIDLWKKATKNGT